MAKKPTHIDNIDATFDEVVNAIAPQSKVKELGIKGNDISKLPKSMRKKELDPAQSELDLHVDRQAEVEGIGMGVLRDGTAFLTGRGLARLVGIENLHIRTISQE